MAGTVWQHVSLSLTVKPTTNLARVCHLRYDQEMWHHHVTLRMRHQAAVELGYNRYRMFFRMMLKEIISLNFIWPSQCVVDKIKSEEEAMTPQNKLRKKRKMKNRLLQQERVRSYKRTISLEVKEKSIPY